MKSIFTTSLLILIYGANVISQSGTSIIYKQVDSISLNMEVNYPPDFDTTKSYPAIVFFFGGGWIGGNTG
ncbi:MAG: hypothetical protein KAT15_01055, partial [Bacteroidales bacterium]|nr:hypothetical protein [Bacteroidales bacterium]